MKKILGGILFIATCFIFGCNNHPINPVPDYMGLVKGATWEYQVTDQSNYIQKVVDRVYDNNNKIIVYKIAEYEASEPSLYFGKCWCQMGNSYFISGTWDKNGLHDYEKPYLGLKLVEKPITNEVLGFEQTLNGASIGKLAATRKETVTVPYGTFEAWVFEGTLSATKYSVWFVPELGMVKKISGSVTTELLTYKVEH